MRKVGFYIHVPFCEKKCPYCDFYSFSADSALKNKYTNVVCNTLKDYSQTFGITVDTLYFGGGTPSLLGDDNLLKIIDTLKHNFSFFPQEVTLEVNPMTLPILNFKKLRNAGINRLSIGVQSFVDEELKLLGRTHTVKDAENTIRVAQNSGFDNISVDLMLATPGQTLDTLKQSLDLCMSKNIQHISAYLLKVEQGTPFFRQKENLHLKNEDEQADMYLFLVSELEKNGFYQYEISNFSKPGYQSKHNLKYWNGDEYIGIGPSAHSYFNGKRFFYPRSLDDFLNYNIKRIEDGSGGTLQEYMMLRLRLNDGLNNDDFKRRFGINIPKKCFDIAKKFEKYNLTQVDDTTIRFTPKGFLVSNELIAKIIL